MDKLTVSGWPGSGSTTLCLLLSYNLKLQLIQGSQFFRLLVKKLSDESTNQGENFINVDNLIGKYLDKTYDNFIDRKLQGDGRFIVESDIAGFRLGKTDYFYSIFLTVDRNERKKRMKVDGRLEDMEKLEIRDKGLENRYRDVHGINFFDLNEIKERNQFVLDTTEVSISEELKIVYAKLLENRIINQAKYDEVVSSTDVQEKNYWNNGKQWFLDSLKSDKLLVTGEEIVTEIVEMFPEEIESLPQDLKQVILSL